MRRGSISATDQWRGSFAQRFVVCSLGLLYTALQWGGASQIGASRIFSKSRNEDRAQFAEMVQSIAALAQTCNTGQGSRRSLLFDDADVVTPYLQSAAGADPRTCSIVRETDVTPFAEQDWKTCGLTFIHEISPGRPQIQTDPYSTRWSSSGGRFGYLVFSPHCAK